MYGKKPIVRQYGLSENQDGYCLVSYFQDQIEVEWGKQTNELLKNLEPNSRLIYAVPAHMIWRKICFFPKHYDESLIYRKIIQILSQSLPIPLSELYFDYHIQILETRIRVALFALRQKDWTEKNSDRKAIFDCSYYCSLRAIHYLLNLPLENIEQYSYHIQHKFLQFKSDRLIICDSEIEQSQLLTLNSNEQEGIVSNDLYLQALGASLWNGSDLI